MLNYKLLLALASTLVITQGEKPTNADELGIIVPEENARASYITNGKDANPVHWPFITPLYQVAGGRIAHICGGSIIHPMFILTAAHCFRILRKDMRGRPSVTMDVDRRGYKLLVGDYNIANMRDGMEVRIDRIIPHQQYKGLQNNDPYDIALIKLAKPLTYNARVKPVPLPPRNAVFDNGMFNCFAAGWGLTNTRPRQKPDFLQQLDFKIPTFQVCKNFWHKWLNPGNMCVGTGQRSTCRGDSGGPTVCPLNNQYTLAGIMSFGEDDCLTRPGVLLKVAPFVPWIQSTIQQSARG